MLPIYLKAIYEKKEDPKVIYFFNFCHVIKVRFAGLFLTDAQKPAVSQILNLPVQDSLNTRLISPPSLED